MRFEKLPAIVSSSIAGDTLCSCDFYENIVTMAHVPAIVSSSIAGDSSRSMVFLFLLRTTTIACYRIVVDSRHMCDQVYILLMGDVKWEWYYVMHVCTTDGVGRETQQTMMMVT